MTTQPAFTLMVQSTFSSVSLRQRKATAITNVQTIHLMDIKNVIFCAYKKKMIKRKKKKKLYDNAVINSNQTLDPINIDKLNSVFPFSIHFLPFFF